MNGLELSEKYYNEYGLPELQKSFAGLVEYMAAGFVGRGSEHYGYDDEVSRDHDFEPGFCIFLPDENIVSRRDAFLLERAYDKLPKEFCGVKRQLLAPVGGRRNGVFRTSEFYLSAVGSKDGCLTLDEWLHIPDYVLAEAVNGKVFADWYGEFSAVRRRLQNMPDDVRRKRIAGNVLVMAQSGQYNFSRCLKHSEPEAAQFACTEFVRAAMKILFLLNGRYMPYYKWSFRALKELDRMEPTAEKLSALLSGNNAAPTVAGSKAELIEELAADMAALLVENGLSAAVGEDLEQHAYSVNSSIGDGYIRNLNIFEAV